jgi:hypothetical protein
MNQSLIWARVLIAIAICGCSSPEKHSFTRPNPVGIQRQERHGRCDYYLTTIEFFYQINDKLAPPDNMLYAVANYSVRAAQPADRRAVKERFKITTDDGAIYFPDPKATAAFDRRCFSDSVNYDGLPYYTSEDLPTGWRDHFAVFVIPFSALGKLPKIVFIGDEQQTYSRPTLDR